MAIWNWRIGSLTERIEIDQCLFSLPNASVISDTMFPGRLVASVPPCSFPCVVFPLLQCGAISRSDECPSYLTKY
jgi:hypothetical protein